MHSDTTPRAGDIAQVRHRQYLVDEVVAPSSVREEHPLVRLTCLDHAQGRPLSVLWERELGARVIRPAQGSLGAPSMLDEPRRFAAYLHELKWSSVTATDAQLFQAPFRASIHLLDHQLSPLKKALDLPRVNLSNMPARRTARWKLAYLLLASALLSACASSSQHSARRDLRLDTETAARLRHAATTSEGASSLAPAATGAVASRLAESVPLLLTLLEDDNAVGELEERLVECARLAKRQVNTSHFGNRAPTRAECGEEVVLDGCAEPITRAMYLGQQKHALALQCAQQVLEQLWPAPFSIEQRYRYYPNARPVETVSREEEARLIAQGCTRELWRTIQPDIVLHADRGSLRRSVLTLDYKFPCPATNEPRWKEYGENSAYVGFNQGEIYRDALGGEAWIISPRRGFSR